MKGFQQKTTGEGNFFVIKHHTICRESKTPQDGFKPIEVTNPRTNEKVTKYIEEYASIEAMITGIEWYDTEQKFSTRYKGFKIHLNANGKKGNLDLPINARVTGRFMKLAENINYTKPVEFRAWKDNRSDSTALLVAQDGQSVPQKYTRENPGNLPEPTQSASTGKWNYDAQMDFLHKRMVEVVIPRVEIAQLDGEQSESPAENAESNGDSTVDAKLIERVKTALTDLGQEKEYEDRSRSELMEEFFGASKFSEIEQMPPEMIKSVLKKIDQILVPF